MIKIHYNTFETIEITLEGNISFSYNFLRQLLEMFYIVENENVKEIIIKKNNDVSMDNLAVAYIYNFITYTTNRLDINVSMFEDLSYKVKKICKESNGIFCENNNILGLGMKAEHFNEVIDALSDRICNMSVVQSREKMEEFLKTTIGEIFSNVMTHNKIETFYFFVDIDSQDDRNLMINVIDYGHTIMSNVNEYLKETNQKMDKNLSRIEWALEHGHTTRKGSGGYGLPTLIKYINQINGKLFIVSSHEMFSLENKNKCFEFVRKGYFPGTIVSFSIKVINLIRNLELNSQKMGYSKSCVKLNDI